VSQSVDKSDIEKVKAAVARSGNAYVTVACIKPRVNINPARVGRALAEMERQDELELYSNTNHKTYAVKQT